VPVARSRLLASRLLLRFSVFVLYCAPFGSFNHLTRGNDMARAKKDDPQTNSDPGRKVQVIKGQSTANADQLQKMIAEAAYYRAQQRGFKGGNPVEDWLVAEREINSQSRAH
jgi:hypothetical protein